MIETNSQRGFTIIELLIATTVFSVILLVVTTGIIRIGNIYYKGIISSRTQEAIRNISNDFSSTLQFANGVKTPDRTPPPGSSSFCLGEIRYTYFVDQEYTKGNEFTTGLFSEDLAPSSNCTTTSSDCIGPTTSNCVKDKRQLLSNNMRILQLAVDPQPGTSSKAWSIKAKVAYGDDDLFQTNADPSLNVCKTGVAGSSFCSVAGLDNIVKKRVK